MLTLLDTVLSCFRSGVCDQNLSKFLFLAFDYKTSTVLSSIKGFCDLKERKTFPFKLHAWPSVFHDGCSDIPGA